MSAKFFQQDTPAENQFIKCNDITCRGHVVIDEYATVGGNLTVTGAETVGGAFTLAANTDVAVGGKISLPAMTKYTQLTSDSTAVNIIGKEQQFVIDTFATGSIAAGANVSFTVFHGGYDVGKTLVLVSNDVSTDTLLTVNTFMAYGGAGAFIITRHNVGAVAAANKQTIIVKLIQSA